VLVIRIVFVGLFALAGLLLARGPLGWPDWIGLLVGLAGGGLIVYGEFQLENRSGREILAGVLGLILGLVVALLIGLITSTIEVLTPYQTYVTVSLSLVLGYLGAVVGIRKRGDIRLSSKQAASAGTPSKILDTSVIIDGRIAEICESHFIEGKIIVPKFVLDELQAIADSSDALRRNRGRRGLEILRRMQLRKDLEVVIDEREPGGNDDVDSKLVTFARQRSGKIITNDFNLNKVAELHGIKVLNVNELANALKPVVLPGEEMTVRITRRGKEPDQGVGYLDDGTMVVVEGASSLVNKTIQVIVTSVLQTAVGRMIFSKRK
jgi:uncharacterized protein YacL